MIKELISSANNEILGILPSFDAFQRQVDAGMFDHIRKASQEKKLIIKILVAGKIELPSGKSEVQIGKSKFRLSFKSKDEDGGGDDKVYEFTTDTIENMTIRSIYSKTIVLQMGMVIVDRSKSIVVEPKQTRSDDFLDYIGMSSYSNSSQISKSYATMFDALWKHVQTSNIFEKSLERLRIYDNMQREFIDILAHDLRTPLQSILGLTYILKERTEEKESKELLETIAENGARLHMFIENVLTATKLQDFLSNISKDVFDLSVLIDEIVDSYKIRFQNLTKSSLSAIKEIRFDCKGLEQECKVKANKFQISMVITNIIDNAINFIPDTQKGLVSITVEQRERDVTVHIKDNGEGIDSEILPRLFTKFTTKWFYGSGLGMYTSQKIIFTHNGVMWGQNNPQNEKGATFSFRLPLIDSFNRSNKISDKENSYR